MTSIRSWGVVCVLAVLSGSACATGNGGTITVPCDDARCNETCVGEGDASGACREDACVCVPAIRPPSGASLGVSSGGVVTRRSDGYSLELTVGPVTPAAVPAGRANLEVGIAPQADPTRTP
jgi:hypothetical protein